jgi:hypothetical protein
MSHELQELSQRVVRLEHEARRWRRTAGLAIGAALLVGAAAWARPAQSRALETDRLVIQDSAARLPGVELSLARAGVLQLRIADQVRADNGGYKLGAPRAPEIQIISSDGRVVARLGGASARNLSAANP